MSIYIGEVAEGSPQISHKPPSITRSHVIINTTSEQDAYIAYRKWLAPTVTLDGCALHITSLNVTKKGSAKDVWEGSVTWGLKTFACQFQTSGGTAHITQSGLTKKIYRGQYLDDKGQPKHSTAAEVPDFGGAIGYNGDGFDGVDITIPQFSWTETYTFLMTKLTWQYVMTLAYLTGSVNKAAFRAFAAGEVLFLGASGGVQKNELEADVTFSFAASPNVKGLTCGSITGIEKGGWDYIWVLYRDVLSGGYRFKQPAGVYVEKVYKDGDFGLLGITGI